MFDDATVLHALTTRCFASTSLKEGGALVASATDHDALTSAPFEAPERLLAGVLVRHGLTVSLGAYEFARVDVSVQCHAEPASLGEVHDWAMTMAKYVCGRQIDIVRGGPPKDRPEPGEPPVGLAYSILGLSYGLTLSLPKMQSAKADVGFSLPCQRGDEGSTWQQLDELVEPKLKAWLNQARR